MQHKGLQLGCRHVGDSWRRGGGRARARPWGQCRLVSFTRTLLSTFAYHRSRHQLNKPNLVTV